MNRLHILSHRTHKGRIVKLTNPQNYYYVAVLTYPDYQVEDLQRIHNEDIDCYLHHTLEETQNYLNTLVKIGALYTDGKYYSNKPFK